MILDKICNQ